MIDFSENKFIYHALFDETVVKINGGFSINAVNEGVKVLKLINQRFKFEKFNELVDFISKSVIRSYTLKPNIFVARQLSFYSHAFSCCIHTDDKYFTFFLMNTGAGCQYQDVSGIIIKKLLIAEAQEFVDALNIYLEHGENASDSKFFYGMIFSLLDKAETSTIKLKEQLSGCCSFRAVFYLIPIFYKKNNITEEYFNGIIKTLTEIILENSDQPRPFLEAVKNKNNMLGGKAENPVHLQNVSFVNSINYCIDKPFIIKKIKHMYDNFNGMSPTKKYIYLSRIAIDMANRVHDEWDCEELRKIVDMYYDCYHRSNMKNFIMVNNYFGMAVSVIIYRMFVKKKAPAKLSLYGDTFSDTNIFMSSDTYVIKNALELDVIAFAEAIDLPLSGNPMIFGAEQLEKNDLMSLRKLLSNTDNNYVYLFLYPSCFCRFSYPSIRKGRITFNVPYTYYPYNLFVNTIDILQKLSLNIKEVTHKIMCDFIPSVHIKPHFFFKDPVIIQEKYFKMPWIHSYVDKIVDQLNYNLPIQTIIYVVFIVFIFTKFYDYVPKKKYDYVSSLTQEGTTEKKNLYYLMMCKALSGIINNDYREDVFSFFEWFDNGEYIYYIIGQMYMTLSPSFNSHHVVIEKDKTYYAKKKEGVIYYQDYNYVYANGNRVGEDPFCCDSNDTVVKDKMDVVIPFVVIKNFDDLIIDGTVRTKDGWTLCSHMYPIIKELFSGVQDVVCFYKDNRVQIWFLTCKYMIEVGDKIKFYDSSNQVYDVVDSNSKMFAGFKNAIFLKKDNRDYVAVIHMNNKPPEETFFNRTFSSFYGHKLDKLRSAIFEMSGESFASINKDDFSLYFYYWYINQNYYCVSYVLSLYHSFQMKPIENMLTYPNIYHNLIIGDSNTVNHPHPIINKFFPLVFDKRIRERAVPKITKFPLSEAKMISSIKFPKDDEVKEEIIYKKNDYRVDIVIDVDKIIKPLKGHIKKKMVHDESSDVINICQGEVTINYNSVLRKHQEEITYYDAFSEPSDNFDKLMLTGEHQYAVNLFGLTKRDKPVHIGSPCSSIIMLFEMLTCKTVRKDQFDLITKIVEANKPHIYQMMMGFGKTAVIIPLVALILSKRFDKIAIIQPHNLVEATKSIFISSVCPISHLDVHDELKNEQGFYIISDSHAKRKVLEDVNIFKEFYIIYDEVDQMADNCKSELNIICERYPVNDIDVDEICNDVLKSITSSNAEKRNGLPYDDKHDYFSNICGLDYGMDLSGRKYLAVPYDAAGTPSAKCEFSDIKHSIIYTYLSLTSMGVLPSELVIKMNTDEMPRELLVCDPVPVTHELIIEYIKLIVKDEHYYKIKNISFIDLFSSMVTKNRFGLTGTPFILGYKDPDNSNVCDVIIQKGAYTRAIHNIWNSGDPLFNVNVIDIINKYDALIDVGAYFLQHDVISLAKLIYEKVNRIVVFVINGKKMMYDKGIYPYVKKKSQFYLFNNGNTTGVDFDISDNAIALVTVDKFNRFRDVVQGMYRMRGLDDERNHKIKFITTYGKITSKELAQKLIDVETVYRNKMKDNYNRQLLSLYKKYETGDFTADNKYESIVENENIQEVIVKKIYYEDHMENINLDGEFTMEDGYMLSKGYEINVAKVKNTDGKCDLTNFFYYAEYNKKKYILSLTDVLVALKKYDGFSAVCLDGTNVIGTISLPQLDTFRKRLSK